MAVGQGFFVVATATNDIVFNNAQRAFEIEASGVSEFLRPENSTAVNQDEKSRVRIGYEDPEGFHRQLLLAFLPNSTADLNFNKGYDASCWISRLINAYVSSCLHKLSYICQYLAVSFDF